MWQASRSAFRRGGAVDLGISHIFELLTGQIGSGRFRIREGSVSGFVFGSGIGGGGRDRYRVRFRQRDRKRGRFRERHACSRTRRAGAGVLGLTTLGRRHAVCAFWEHDAHETSGSSLVTASSAHRLPARARARSARVAGSHRKRSAPAAGSKERSERRAERCRRRRTADARG